MNPTNATDDLANRFQFLASAVSYLGEGVLMTDGDLNFPGPHIVFVNEAMTKLTGYSVDELLGETPRLFQGPETDRRLLERLKKTLLAKRPFTGETLNYRKDGSTYYVEWHISPVLNAEGEVVNFISIQRDITERKATEERLLQSERLAAIGRAMTGLAHESRNALQRNQANLEMLAGMLKDRPDAQKYLNRMQKAQEDLQQLYEEVRRYASPMHIKPRTENLKTILQSAWVHLSPSREQVNATLKITDGDAEPICDVDPFAFEQVFRNILENSLSICSEPIEISVQFSQFALAGEPAVTIVIRDNGPGFEANNLPRVFDEFFTTKTHGTGLGLAIVKRIVVAHHGMVVANPVQPRGAEFVITLPKSASM